MTSVAPGPRQPGGAGWHDGEEQRARRAAAGLIRAIGPPRRPDSRTQVGDGGITGGSRRSPHPLTVAETTRATVDHTVASSSDFVRASPGAPAAADALEGLL